jgi:tetratricopeptide (TPR) repeat protein
VAAGGSPFAAAIKEADAAWTAGQFPSAKAAYTRALALDSSASTRAVYRLAVLHSWDGNLRGAIPLFARYVLLEPRDEEGRIALAKAYAWSGATERAVAVYDSILGRDATYRDAALGAAQALAWAGRFKAALGRYDDWLGRTPRDVEAGLARARTLAWAGRLREAEAAYLELESRGERLEASKGVALVAAWRGELGRSEGLWRALTGKLAKDPEVWVGLAQVLRWAGRAEAARSALDRALAANPAYPDAREQMRWVRAELNPTVQPGAVAAWDSDGNRSLQVAVSGSVRPLPLTRLTLSGSHRWTELDALSGTSKTARAALRVEAPGHLTVTVEAGATLTRSGEGTGARDRRFAVGGSRATVRLSNRLSLGGGVARSAFDETTQLIQSGIITTSWTAEGEWQLPGRLVLGGGGEVARLEGGSGTNRRHAGFTALRWQPRRSFSLGLAGRGFNYDKSPRDGYFAPAHFRLGELSGRYALAHDLGWALTLDLGIGAQRVEFDGPATTSGTQRVGLSVAYLPRPGAEFALKYEFSNVAGAGAVSFASGSVYHASNLSLRVRLTPK